MSTDTISPASMRMSSLRKSLPVAILVGAIVATSAHADTQNPDHITIAAPVVKTVGRDYAIDAPIEKTTVTARVQFDPLGLTNKSGVAHLNDAVLDAARKACYDADPLTADDDTCVQEALKSAKPQIRAAIARAKQQHGQ